jgi:hypothetical protein
VNTLSPRYVSPEYAALQAELLEGIAQGEARVALRQLAQEYPQVTGFSQLSTDLSKEELRKLSDLGKLAGHQPRKREILADQGKRWKKFTIETGYDWRNDFYDWSLEPWTCPGDADETKDVYREIMLADDAVTSIGDYSGDRLAVVSWLREEDLISVGDHGEIHALSDARAKGQRSYPGAPCTDARAKIGHNLMDHARGLILAALFNLSRGRTVRRSRKRAGHAAETGDGLRLSAAQVCAEANAIKSRRADLDDCRFLSLSRCRELIRALVNAEVIEQVEPPRAVRRDRSWRTIPRVIRRLTADVAEQLGLRPPPQEEAPA